MNFKIYQEPKLIKKSNGIFRKFFYLKDKEIYKNEAHIFLVNQIFAEQDLYLFCRISFKDDVYELIDELNIHYRKVGAEFYFELKLENFTSLLASKVSVYSFYIVNAKGYRDFEDFVKKKNFSIKVFFKLNYLRLNKEDSLWFNSISNIYEYNYCKKDRLEFIQ